MSAPTSRQRTLMLAASVSGWVECTDADLGPFLARVGGRCRLTDDGAVYLMQTEEGCDIVRQLDGCWRSPPVTAYTLGNEVQP